MIRVDNYVIKPGQFPDGTLMLKVDGVVFEQYKNQNQPVWVDWFYESDAEMFTLQCVVDILRRNHTQNLNLYMPYCPHARMDRIKSDYENFSLKVFANWLNGLKFECVFVENIHSVVGEALIENIINKQPELDIRDCLGYYHPDIIFFPDEGAYKRYGDLHVVKNSNLPIAFGIKKRDWKTGQILGLDVFGENIEGKKILIVDDILSKGYTFFYSGKKLREMGAKDVALYVTHCENTVQDGELLTTDYISKIYTTNSICKVKNPKINIIRELY